MASNKIPKNQKLWNSLRKQAEAKYPNRRKMKGISQPAAKWLSEQYERSGGTYVSSRRELEPKDRDIKQEQIDSKKRKINRLKAERKKQGFV